MVKESMYTHIDEHTLKNFNKYWDQYASVLPSLPTLIHNYEDGKAAVFNTWLRNSDLYEKVYLKPEKQFTHNLVEQLSLKFNTVISTGIKEELNEKLKHKHFQFLFSYFVTRNVLMHMEQFIQLPEQENLRKLAPKNYYVTTLDDFNDDDPIFYVLKQLSVEYVHAQITSQIANKIYNDAIQCAEEICQ